MTFEGQINEILPDGRFGVTLENGHRLIVYTAGANGAGSDPSGVKRYGIGAVAPVSKNHNIQSKDKDDDELL